MQKDLDHGEAVGCQIFFPVCDLLITLFPNVLVNEIPRKLPLMDQIMNARHDDVFILRTVENADISALRQGFIDAPHVIMILLLTCRLFEGDDLHAARIEARKDMVHRTVLAGRIHRLQDDNEAVGILGIELFLKHLQLFDGFRKISFLHFCFLDLHIAGRREIFQ